MRRDALLAAGAFLLAAATAFLVIRPIHAAAVDFDSAASVVYFDRIISGRHLEANLGATPKPFLTVVFGILYDIFHDWRVLVWATIGAYASGISVAALVARRVAGLGAAAFATIALIASSALLIDVSRGYAVAWALLGWAAAGLAVTAQRPRYDIAATALFLASLARIETFMVLATAAAALLAASVLGRHRAELAPPRSAWVLLVAFLALPVMLLHDWLLIGDPLYFAAVSARFSAAVPDVIAGQTPSYMAGWVTRFILGFGAVTALAILGLVLLIRQRQNRLVLGLLALGPGVGSFLVFLTVRGTYVSTRYAMPIELAILFLAGVGFGALRVPWLVAWVRDLMRHRPAWRSNVGIAVPVFAVVVAVLCAALMVRPFGPGDVGTNRSIHTQLNMAADGDRLVPRIRDALRLVPGAFDWPPYSSVPAEEPTPSMILLDVPALEQPRFALDLDLPLFRIAATSQSAITPEALAAAPGRVIYHDRRGDTGADLRGLESTSQTITLSGVTLVLLTADPERGYWLWQVAPRGTASQPQGPAGS